MVISHFINVSIEILIYFLVSILCLFIGRKVLDWITPYDLNNQTSIEKNIAAGIVHCRLKYWRVPRAVPNTTQGKAEYWKKYYNTEGGKGHVDHFVDAVKKWLV